MLQSKILLTKLFGVLLSLFPLLLLSQTANRKEITQQTQTWVSLNTVTKFSDHWGLAADIHVRTNDFFKDNNFFFLRSGVSYIPNNKFSFSGGYAHMWLAPRNRSWSTFSDENRLYQQVQMITKQGNVALLQRIRNEQRWQEIIVNDLETGKNRFSNRVRYLFSATIPVFKSKNAPLLVLSNELLVHFGNDIILNAFDQNRFFVGIKKSVNSKLNFDFGYMNVYQQRPTGYQYDMNHTLRLFFYMSSSIAHAD